MGRGYSLDLRERVAGAAVSGETVREVAARFEVSPATVVRWAGLLRRTGSAAMAPQGSGFGGGKLAPHQDCLTAWVDAQPDMTLEELATKLFEERGVRAHIVSVWRLLGKAGYTYKKTAHGQRAWSR